MSIRPIFDRWEQYDRRMREAVADLSADQLALRASPAHLPIWGLIAHAAGARVYWLCAVVGEPGADRTPWPELTGEGWEDHPEHPRGADELIMALETSWSIVDGVLERWTPERLPETVIRAYGQSVQVHTRASILQRLLTHDAFHSGEVSQLLGLHGLPEIDLWRADRPAASAPASDATER
jgi:uncharacterized damage-inducible protein DinB